MPIMLKSSYDASIAEAYAWALQTIGLAICLRAETIGTPIDGPNEVRACELEARDVARQLRREALEECGVRPAAYDYRMRLADKVLAWCIEHRGWH